MRFTGGKREQKWFKRSLRFEDQVIGDGTMEVSVSDRSVLKSDVYYDEPKNLKEIDKHPDKEAIKSSTEKVGQQLMDMTLKSWSGVD